MENLILSAGIVCPLLILMLVGMLVRRVGFLDETLARRLNKIVFYVTMPAMSYKSIAEGMRPEAGQLRPVLWILGGIVVAFVVAFFIVPRFTKDNARRGVIVQGACRGNDIVFGLAVAAALMSPDDLSLMMITIAMTAPLFSLLSILELEYFRGGKPKFFQLLRKIVVNPVIISCGLGLIAREFSFQLPEVFQSALNTLSGANTALAFLILGATLSLSSVKENRLALTATSLVKLILLPAVGIGTLLLLGYRGAPIAVGMVIFGAPTAIVSFPLATELDGDARLAGEMVAVTSLLSILTMFLWIFLCKQLGVM